MPNEQYYTFTDFEPYVSTHDCFDVLGVPPDHVSRRPSDTFYRSPTECLRTHTSVYEVLQMRKGFNSFLVVGDVYRKDTIDRSHYPVFHQMEGVRLLDHKSLGIKDSKEGKEICFQDLKRCLEGLSKSVFGDVE